MIQQQQANFAVIDIMKNKDPIIPLNTIKRLGTAISKLLIKLKIISRNQNLPYTLH